MRAEVDAKKQDEQKITILERENYWNSNTIYTILRLPS